jgi:hypothetical protein
MLSLLCKLANMNIISKMQSRIDKRSNVIMNYEYQKAYEIALYKAYPIEMGLPKYTSNIDFVLKRLRIFQKTDKEALATILWQRRKVVMMTKMLLSKGIRIIDLDKQL